MSTVRAVVRGDLRIYDLAAKSIERLIQTFTFENPKFGMLKAIGRDTSQTQEFIQALEEYPDGSIAVPRGTVEIVKKALLRDGVTMKFEDKRAWGSILDYPEASVKTLRPYQEEGAKAIADRVQGMIVLGCGGGKTVLGVVGVSRIKRHTLVLVHTHDLLSQWVKEFKDLGFAEVGVVASGVAHYRPFTVAIIDTLIKRLAIDRDEIEKFGVCVIDEAHHSPSATYQKLLPKIPAAYRIGLTATPDREDRLERLMHWSFGTTLLNVPAQDLIRMGYLMRPEIEPVFTPFMFVQKGPDKKKNAELNRAITTDAIRNETIVRIAVRDALAGETVVILSNDRAHCRLLARMCWERGAEAKVIIAGGSSKKAKLAREDAIESLRDGRCRLATATSLFDEGISINRLSRVILALPQGAMTGTEQKIGRTMRLLDGKQPKIYDIVDSRDEGLQRRWMKRRRVYKRLELIS